MATSSRFAVSVHVLSALALSEAPVPSNMLAKSASTGAVVIRQLLGRLRAAELVACRLGKGGGALLARPATEITLLEIFDAVESPSLFCTHRSAPNHKCRIGRNVLAALGAVTNRAEAALRAELAGVTLRQFADEVWTMEGSQLTCDEAAAKAEEVATASQPAPAS